MLEGAELSDWLQVQEQLEAYRNGPSRSTMDITSLAPEGGA